jgi:hypothetical protein
LCAQRLSACIGEKAVASDRQVQHLRTGELGQLPRPPLASPPPRTNGGSLCHHAWSIGRSRRSLRDIHFATRPVRGKPH